ncbi:MAG: dynamin family protein [Synergistaceae bacterium]|nr:dynamin family protein [Synergistaceae bacterium]
MAIDVREIQEKRDSISAIIQSAAEILNKAVQLGTGFNDQDRDNLQLQAKAIKEDAFKIVVAGEFKNGKSTFVNAIIGKKIMPEDTLPCTGTITEVKYGSQEKAEIYFLDPLPEKISPFIPDKVKAHINKYRSGQIPPLSLTVREYQECVRIPEDEADLQAKSLELMPFSHAVVYYPLDELKNGINIIDTPGLNEDPRREAITKSYIGKANAVIFVFKCPKYQGMNDENYINNIIRVASKDIFFVCTFLDQVKSDDRERLARRAANYLKNFTDLGESAVFLVSSTEGTNINEFSEALSNYLKNQNVALNTLRNIRGKVLACIKGIQSSIKIYSSALGSDLNQRREILQAANLILNEAESKKKYIVDRLNSACDKLLTNVVNSLGEKYTKILQEQIPSFVSQMELQNKITLAFWNNDRQREAIKQEMSGKLKTFFDAEISKWADSDLRSIIEKFANNLRKELESELKDFYAVINKFDYNIGDVEVNAQKDSILDRLGGKAILKGAAVAGTGYTLAGFLLGFGSVNTVIGGAISTILSTSTIFPPVAIAAAIAAAVYVAFNLWTYSDDATKKFKHQVQISFVDSMLKEKDNNCNNYASGLINNFKKQLTPIKEGLEAEIAEKRSIVKALERDINSAQEKRDRKSQELNGLITELDIQSSKLNNLSL